MFKMVNLENYRQTSPSPTKPFNPSPHRSAHHNQREAHSIDRVLRLILCFVSPSPSSGTMTSIPLFLICFPRFELAQGSEPEPVRSSIISTSYNFKHLVMQQEGSSRRLVCVCVWMLRYNRFLYELLY